MNRMKGTKNNTAKRSLAFILALLMVILEIKIPINVYATENYTDDSIVVSADNLLDASKTVSSDDFREDTVDDFSDISVEGTADDTQGEDSTDELTNTSLCLNNTCIPLSDGVYYKNDGSIGTEEDYNVYLSENQLTLKNALFGDLSPASYENFTVRLIGDNVCSNEKYGVEASVYGFSMVNETIKQLNVIGDGNLTFEGKNGTIAICAPYSYVSIETTGTVKLDMIYKTPTSAVVCSGLTLKNGTYVANGCVEFTSGASEFICEKEEVEISSYKPVLYAGKNVDMSMIDSTVKLLGDSGIATCKSFTIQNSNVELESASSSMLAMDGTFTMDSGSFSCWQHGTGVIVLYANKIIQNAGSIEIKNDVNNSGTIAGIESIEINGGSFTVNAKETANALQCRAGDITVNDGTVTVTTEYYNAINAQNIRINGGIVKAENTTGRAVNPNYDLVMTGGKLFVTAKEGATTAALLVGSITSSSTMHKSAGGNLSVTNATIKVENYGKSNAVSAGNTTLDHATLDVISMAEHSLGDDPVKTVAMDLSEYPIRAQDSELTVSAAADGIYAANINANNCNIDVKATGEVSNAFKLSPGPGLRVDVSLVDCKTTFEGVKTALEGPCFLNIDGGSFIGKAQDSNYPAVNANTSDITINGNVYIEGCNVSTGSKSPAGVANFPILTIKGGCLEIVNKAGGKALMMYQAYMNEDAASYVIWSGDDKQSAVRFEKGERDPAGQSYIASYISRTYQHSYIKIGGESISNVTIAGLTAPSSETGLMTSVQVSQNDIPKTEIPISWDKEFDEYYTGTYTATITISPETGFVFNENTVVVLDNVELTNPKEDLEGVSYQINKRGQIVITKEFFVKGKLREYAISYNVNGGTNPEDAPKIYNEESDTIILPIPTRKGYSFENWYVGPDYQNTISEIPTGSSGNINLFARWVHVKYNITYENLDGAENDETNPTEFYIDSSDLKLKQPTKTGYSFKGWYKDAEFTQSYSVIKKGTTEDLILYAKWELANYSIQYHFIHGTNDPENPSFYTMESEDITLKKPTRRGYTFYGWYSDSTYKTLNNVVPKGSTGTKDFYGGWVEDTYQIKYILNEGSNHIDNPRAYSVTSDSIYLKDPNRRGYTFEGWYEDEEFTKRITSIPWGSIGDRTLYAKWEETVYNITYELNGGTMDETNPTTFTITSQIKILDPVKTGYRFGGWYRDEELMYRGGLFRTGNVGDASLYASWSPETYYISYLLDGGENNSENPQNYTIESDTITLAAPTKKYYSFDGWYKDESFQNEVTEIPHGNSGVVYLYAKWNLNHYKISFDANGGSGSMNDVEGLSKIYQLPVNQFEAPVGMRFKGWSLTADGDVVNAVDMFEDKMVYAIWEKDPDYHNFSGETCQDKCLDCGIANVKGVHNLVEVVADEYLAYNATCTKKALYYKSCVDCKASSEGTLQEATFEYGETAGHTYEGRKCIVCGEVEEGYTRILWSDTYFKIDGDTLYIDGTGEIPEFAFVEGLGTKLDASVKHVVIGDQITSIGDLAFSGCSNIETVAMNSVTSIAIGTFINCSALSAIQMDSVQSIQESAFENCYSLTSVSMPKLRTIESTVFTFYDRESYEKLPNTALESVTLGSVVPEGFMEGFQLLQAKFLIPAEAYPLYKEYESQGFVLCDVDTGKKICEHSFAENAPLESINDKKHGRKCEKCDEIIETGDHTFIVSNTDASEHICLECGAAKKHNFTSQVMEAIVGQCIQKESCTQSGEYYKVCAVCHTLSDETFEVAKFSHQLEIVAGSAKIPTCIEKGKEADKKCKNCTYVETGKDIAAKGHTVVTDEAIAPTCDKPGKIEGSHCSVCNTVLNAQNTVPATEKHSWDGGKVTKKATLKVAGKKVFTCKDCGKTNEESIAKLKSQKITVDKAVSKKVTLKAKNLTKNKTYNIKAKAKTSVSYKVTKTPKKAGKYISVSKKGAITLKKKAPKGTYEITVTAKETAIYGAATKKIIIAVK